MCLQPFSLDELAIVERERLAIGYPMITEYQYEAENLRQYKEICKMQLEAAREMGEIKVRLH